MSSPWPTRGPDFNAWNLNLREFMAILDDAVGESWWGSDFPLKYLNIRVDTRENAFLLFAVSRGGEPEKISPDRVIEAIRKHREMYGGKAVKLRGRATDAPSNQD